MLKWPSPETEGKEEIQPQEEVPHPVWRLLGILGSKPQLCSDSSKA